MPYQSPTSCLSPRQHRPPFVEAIAAGIAAFSPHSFLPLCGLTLLSAYCGAPLFGGPVTAGITRSIAAKKLSPFCSPKPAFNCSTSRLFAARRLPIATHRIFAFYGLYVTAHRLVSRCFALRCLPIAKLCSALYRFVFYGLPVEALPFASGGAVATYTTPTPVRAVFDHRRCDEVLTTLFTQSTTVREQRRIVGDANATHVGGCFATTVPVVT